MSKPETYLLLILWPDGTVKYTAAFGTLDEAREASRARGTSGLHFNYAVTSSRERVALDFASECRHIIRAIDGKIAPFTFPG